MSAYTLGSVRAPMVVLLTTLLTSGCTLGSSAARSDVARSPEGAVLTIRTVTGEESAAELVLVEPGGPLLVLDGRLAFVPWARFRLVEFPARLGLRDITGGWIPDERVQDHIRFVSRHPYGLTEEQLRTVLSSLGQQSVDTLGGLP